MKFNISTTVLPMQADQLFAERDTAAFQALLMKSLKLGRMEFVSIDKDMSQGAYIVKLVTQPELGSWVPKSLRKYLEGPNGIEYTDTLTYHPSKLRAAPYVLHCTTTPSFFSDKVDIHSTLTIAEEGPQACRQILQGEVNVKIVGLGRLIENVIVESLKQTYAVLPQVVERWCAIREELLKHPDGPAILRKGAPFDLHPTPHPPDLAPQGPLITLASDDHEGPPGAPGGAAGAEGGAEMQPGYKSRRPSSLCVDGLETYKSLRSLQAPYVGTPLTGAGVSTAVKRKRPSGGGDGTGGAAKVKGVGGDVYLSRLSATQPQHPLQQQPGSGAWSESYEEAMDTDRGPLEELVSCGSGSMSMEGSFSRSGNGRPNPWSPPPSFKHQSLHLQDFLNNKESLLTSREAHSEAGTEYHDPAADWVYCSCGECGECMQDVQTAAAIMGDRQRAISELSGAEGCAELHLPEGQVEGVFSAPPHPTTTNPPKRTGTAATAAASHAAHSVLDAIRRRAHGRGSGWEQLEEHSSGDIGHVVGRVVHMGAEDSHTNPTTTITNPLDAALLPPLLPPTNTTNTTTTAKATAGAPPRGAGHRRGSSLQAVYTAAAAKLQPGQWSTFNDNFAQWQELWEELDVAEAPLPNTAARLLHLLALLHSWNLLKFVDPTSGKTIKPSRSMMHLQEYAGGATTGTPTAGGGAGGGDKGGGRSSSSHKRGMHVRVDAHGGGGDGMHDDGGMHHDGGGYNDDDGGGYIDAGMQEGTGKVRVRGRWLFRCFGCYVPEDELLLVEAERLQNKIERQERADETHKKRLLLGGGSKGQ